MESKLAKAAERALVEATQRLNPEERLNAFLVHCRLVIELYEAGRKMRAGLPHDNACRQRSAMTQADYVAFATSVMIPLSTHVPINVAARSGISSSVSHSSRAAQISPKD
jgi:hypothetical protein